MTNLKSYLLENTDVLKQLVSELNGWNGCLDHLDVHENDEEFFEIYFSGNPQEAVRAAHYGEYSFTDEYVKFNAYGNLESLSEYYYEEELKSCIDEIIECLIENKDKIDIDDELSELLED